MPLYLTFELVERKPKTKVYHVISKHHGDVLGEIKWYAPWRQYCFFPTKETVWSLGCLNEVMRFLNGAMESWKKGEEKP